MASPQKENGYIGIAYDIWEALTRTRIPGQSMQVLLFILRKTYGWKKKEDQISLSQFQEATNLTKIAVCKSIRKLLDMNLITKKGNAKSMYTKIGGDLAVTYSFQKNYDKWNTLPKKEIYVTKKGNIDYQKRKSTLPNWDTTILGTILDTKQSMDCTVPSILPRAKTDTIEKLHPIQKLLNDRFPNIKKLKLQLTRQEAERLEIDYTQEELSDYFFRMENYNLLAKKNISVYLTFKNWHRKDNPINKKQTKLPRCSAGHRNTYIRKHFGKSYLLACDDCSAVRKIMK